MWPYWWEPYVAVFGQGARALMNATGASYSSYVRTAAHNAEVGGAPTSQHLIGTAIDLVPGRGSSNRTIAAQARAMGFGYVLDEGDHVHVQLFPAGVIPQWVYDSLVGAAAPRAV